MSYTSLCLSVYRIWKNVVQRQLCADVRFPLIHQTILILIKKQVSNIIEHHRPGDVRGLRRRLVSMYPEQIVEMVDKRYRNEDRQFIKGNSLQKMAPSLSEPERNWLARYVEAKLIHTFSMIRKSLLERHEPTSTSLKRQRSRITRDALEQLVNFLQ